MQKIYFRCLNCSHHASADIEKSGEFAECPTCKNQVLVPEPELEFKCGKCDAPMAAASTLSEQMVRCVLCGEKTKVPELVTGSVSKRLTVHKVERSLNERTYKNSCPHCQAQLPDEAVLCTRCGYNLETGKRARKPISLAPFFSGLKRLIGGVGTSALEIVLLVLKIAVVIALILLAVVVYRNVTGHQVMTIPVIDTGIGDAKPSQNPEEHAPDLSASHTPAAPARNTPRSVKLTCPQCDGEGTLSYIDDREKSRRYPCRICGAQGGHSVQIPPGGDTCPDCKGMGRVERTTTSRSVSVRGGSGSTRSRPERTRRIEASTCQRCFGKGWIKRAGAR